jgi:hypothetical protein
LLFERNLYNKHISTITLQDVPDTFAKKFASSGVTFDVFVQELDNEWEDHKVGMRAGNFAEILRKE